MVCLLEIMSQGHSKAVESHSSPDLTGRDIQLCLDNYIDKEHRPWSQIFMLYN